ncbi:hypothetical protein Aduo_018642 [Ancylostoma duodenale]
MLGVAVLLFLLYLCVQTMGMRILRIILRIIIAMLCLPCHTILLSTRIIRNVTRRHKVSSTHPHEKLF